MSIDELKNEMRDLSAPERMSFDQHEAVNQSSKFIDRLKKADLKSKGILRRFYIIYFAIALFYFGLFILNPDPDLKFIDRFYGTLLFIGILLFAIMGRTKYAELQKLRYDQPTRAFLNKTLDRYKFWTPEMNFALLIMVLINIVSCRSYVENYPKFESLWLNILSFQIVFFIVMSIGLYFGHQHWVKHKKPMVDELKNLLIEEG
jgi:hypothetical protein